MNNIENEKIEEIFRFVALNREGVLEKTKLKFETFSDTERLKSDIMWIHHPDEVSESGAAIIKYYPGGVSPLHLHPSYELIYIFEGEMITDQGVVKKGDLVILPPGSKHSSKSDIGCLALIIWDKPVCSIKESV